jgi:metal-responsive CopG/Arc/MetJ family transcriptional regulator
MKTAISIPDDIYQTAELVARQRHVSRSALFTDAISEFIQRHPLPRSSGDAPGGNMVGDAA